MEIKGKVGSRETLNKIEGEGWYLNERISKGRIGFCWTKCREEGSAVPPQVCFSPLLVGSLTSRVSLSGTKQKSGDSLVGPSLPPSQRDKAKSGDSDSSPFSFPVFST